jgi:hypothetical protein
MYCQICAICMGCDVAQQRMRGASYVSSCVFCHRFVCRCVSPLLRDVGQCYRHSYSYTSYEMALYLTSRGLSWQTHILTREARCEVVPSFGTLVVRVVLDLCLWAEAVVQILGSDVGGAGGAAAARPARSGGSIAASQQQGQPAQPWTAAATPRGRGMMLSFHSRKAWIGRQQHQTTADADAPVVIRYSHGKPQLRLPVIQQRIAKTTSAPSEEPRSDLLLIL